MSILITKKELLKKIANGELEDLLSTNDHIVIGKIYKFKKKIYWCDFRKGLFSGPKDQEISITKIQKRIVEILIKNPDDMITPEEIIKYAWNGKEVDIATFRNMIKQIRDKTYYDLISNKSNVGYKIDYFGDNEKKIVASSKTPEKKNKLTLDLLANQIKEIQRELETLKASTEIK